MGYKLFNMSKLTLKNLFFSMKNALWMNVQGVHILLYKVRNKLLCNKYIDYLYYTTLYSLYYTMYIIIYNIYISHYKNYKI